MLPKQNRRIMNKLASCHRALPVAILLALLVCGHSQTSSAQSSGGLSASASGSLSSSNGGISGQAGADASLGSSGLGSGSAQSLVSGSIDGGSGAGSIQAGGSLTSTSDNSGVAATSASGSASVNTVASSSSVQSYVPSTAKPEGLFSKMKDMVKTSLTGESKEDEQQRSGSVSVSAGASLSSGELGRQKSEGLLDKLGDAAKKGKEMIKETAKGVKDDVKSILKPGESGSSSASASASGSVKLGGASADAKVQIGGSSKEGPIAKLMNKGQEIVHKIENKASEMTKPSGVSAHADAQVKVGGGGGAHTDAQVKIGGASANAKAQIGSSRSGEKSLAVEVLDKVHEMSKAPMEQALKPIDKALGYKEDPLIKAMDQTESILRKPVSELAKPVESIISGAFHTSEEARLEQERVLGEQERREIRLHEDRARMDGRSVLGQITDRTVELAEKPLEVIMKQIGLEKHGQKNPLIKLIDEIYGLTKKPIDAVAKPFEDILRKMAEGKQPYQLSVRYAGSDSDPKLFTRLADGALNIADRVVTRPIEFVMRPLGYDRKTNRNPIVDATHSLKNATKIGLELFMKPIDRIIKEIADIGEIKNEAQREAEIQRRRQDASRIVAALDKLHEVAQTPFEIVLKPVSKVLGYTKDGQKEPLMRVWDIAHEVAMVPLQVFSKPLEDAVLGERKRPRFNVKSEVRVGQGQAKVTAKSSVNGAQGGSGTPASTVRGAQSEGRKNLFVDGIKKIEKFAAKPIDVITSPIRKLILGEDDRIGAGRGFQAKAKAKVGSTQVSAKVQAGGADNQPDKIVQTIKKINNVVLRPLEVMTQPISDMVSPDDGKLRSKIDVRVQGSSQVRGQENAHASVTAMAGGSKFPASGSTQMRVQENAHASVAASASGSKFPVSGSTQMRVQENAHASMSAAAGASKVSASGSASGPGSGQAQASGSLVTPIGSVSGSASVLG